MSASQSDIHSRAAESLLAMSTLGRDAAQQDVDKLTRRVLRDSHLRAYLPALIMFLRNHQKSMVSRKHELPDDTDANPAKGEDTGEDEEDDPDGRFIGLGEKRTPCRLILAVFKRNPGLGRKLMEILPLYGCWKDLNVIYTLSNDKLCEPEMRRIVSELYAQQLRVDLARLDAAEAAEEDQRTIVSQASKYMPHEHRLKPLGKAIARVMFPGNQRCWQKLRKIRSRLNEANGHIVEIFLSGQRADEIVPSRICAGAFAKMPLALLNRKLKSPDDERHDNPKRRALRDKLMKSLTKRLPPAPSNMFDMLRTLMGFQGACNLDSPDNGMAILIRKSFDSVVKLQTEMIQKQLDEGVDLAKLLLGGEFKMGLVQEDSVTTQASEDSPTLANENARMNDDDPAHVSESDAFPNTDSKHTNQTTLDNDSLQNAAKHVLKPIPNFTVVAHLPQSDHGRPDQYLGVLVAMLLARITRSLDTEQRPKVTLLLVIDSVIQDVALDMDDPITMFLKVVETASNMRSKYDWMGDALNGEHLNRILNSQHYVNDNIIVVSGFTGKGLQDALEGLANTDNRTVSLYRRVEGNQRVTRVRELDFDPYNPTLAVCFVLDTTGSMSSSIADAQGHIRSILDTVTSANYVNEVYCSFVSYKDFGDHGHPEVFDWVASKNQTGILQLVRFLNGLHASGGADEPEDVAEAFEQAHKLFCELPHQRSLKMVIHIADAGAHGFTHTYRDRKVHEGVCQKQRLAQVVEKLFNKQQVEYAMCNPGRHASESLTNTLAFLNEKMKVFGAGVEAVKIGSDFGELMSTTLVNFASSAIVPPGTKGVDTVTGQDFSVVSTLFTSRVSDLMRLHVELNAKAAIETAPRDDENEEEVVDVVAEGVEDMLESDSESDTESDHESVDPEARRSALSALTHKLEHDNFRLVYAALLSLGQDWEAQVRTIMPEATLQDKCLVVLAKSGVSLAQLQDAGYPEEVVSGYEAFLTRAMVK